MAWRLWYGWHVVCYEVEFARHVVYATYDGVSLVACLYCISNGLQDCIYEDKTAGVDPTEPLGKVGRRTEPPKKLRHHAGAIMSVGRDGRRSKNAQLKTGRVGVHGTVTSETHISTFAGSDGSAACVPKVLVYVTDDVSHLHDDCVGLLAYSMYTLYYICERVKVTLTNVCKKVIL